MMLANFSSGNSIKATKCACKPSVFKNPSGFLKQSLWAELITEIQKYLVCLGLAWNLKFLNLPFPLIMLWEAEWSCGQNTGLGVRGSSLYECFQVLWNPQMKGAPRRGSIPIFTSAKEPFAHTVQYSILGVALLFDVNPWLVRTMKTDSSEATAWIRGRRVPWSQKNRDIN